MPIYSIPINAPYYQSVAQYVHQNHTNNLLNLKIIVPTGQDCRYLQQCLIEEANAEHLLLPQIVPLNNILTEGDLHHTLPHQLLMNYNKRRFYQIGMMARILTNVLADLSLHTAFILAPSILDIIKELKLNNTEPNKLLEIEYQDKAQHHINSVNTLYDIYKIWEEELHYDDADICSTLFENHITELDNNHSAHTLIIGTFANNHVERNFIRNLIRHPRATYILPPITQTNDENLSLLLDELSEEEKKYEALPVAFTSVTECSYQRFLNADLDDAPISTDNIEVLLFDNVHTQIVHALKIAKQHKSFALVAPNSHIAQRCITLLQKFDIDYISYVSNKLHHTNQFTLFALIAEDLACSEFSIKNFLSICLHPYIRNEEVQQLDYLIRKNPKNRTVESIINYAEELGLTSIKAYLERRQFLQTRHFSFSRFIREYISLAENFTNKIYIGDAGKKLVEVLQDIQNISLDVRLGAQEYRDLFLSLTENTIYTDEAKSGKGKIHLISPENCVLYNYDAFYMLECNQGVFPVTVSYDPWLGDNIRHDLGLLNNGHRTQYYNYMFYLLLYKAKLYLARSQYSLGEILLESRLLGHLKSIYNIKETHIQCDATISAFLEEEINDTQAIIYLPAQISATSVERLIKDPYEFWLRNIIKIRELDSLDAKKEQFRDFGIFVHRVIELFSDKSVMQDIHIAQDRWQAISENIIEDQKVLNSYAAIWRPKIAKIFFLYSDFINQRESNYTLYTEYKGSTVIDLGYREITITSIADRIEVKDNGDVTIIDFKTGSIPTKDEVKKGAAVQMLIEAIILADGGFTDIKWNKQSIKCVYVRIGSQLDTPEYLEVDLSYDDIKQHKKGLEKLLASHDNVNINEYEQSVN